MSSNKDYGNAAFKNKEFVKAIDYYTAAIKENPSDHTIYGNRASAFQNIREYENALEDAEDAIKINPQWGKGYLRKAAALHGRKKLWESYNCYKKAIELDPSISKLVKTGMHAVLKDHLAKLASPPELES